MRVHLLILLLLFTHLAYGGENLQQTEYIGSWTQTHPVTKGEVTSLIIAEDFSVRFKRDLSSAYPDQEFETGAGGVHFVDDIAIVELPGDNGKLAYKLVLSGWRVGECRKVFGTMFMYRDDKVFNGLPISFQNREC